MLTPVNLKTEYANNPLGIDTRQPRFSWELLSDQPGQVQTAYEILAARTMEALNADQGDLWSSQVVRSAVQTHVEYAGAHLKSGQRVYWKVRAWDKDEQAGSWSFPAWFEMGLLEPTDWVADWVGFPAGSPGRALYIRREVQVQPGYRGARAYIAGLGYYELSVNGARIGERVLEPAQTDTLQRVLYAVYDLSECFSPGANAVGILLGGGWYGCPKVMAQFRLDYADGQATWIATGWSAAGENVEKGGWQCAAGPILENSVFDGEVYDARLEVPGWDTPRPGRPIDHWMMPMRVDSPGGRLVAQTLEPIRVVETRPVKLVAEPSPGLYVFDTGQNLAGWARLRVRGERGTRVTLKFAETLYPDGSVNQENLRSARAADVYILKGEGIETWEPRFTYHGFRYIQLEGYPGIPTEEAVQVCVVRSAVQPAGEFDCSDELLNRIHRLAWWTEASNLHGLPTDCPQRDERMGWLNDMTVRVEEALFNFDLVRLYEKWTGDICDAQDPLSGAISDTAPYRWGSRPADPVSASFLRVGWLLYRRYGDRRVLQDHFAAYKQWVDFLTSRSLAGILHYSYYGDWAPPIAEGVEGNSPVSANTPGALVSTAFFVFSARLLAASAAVLGYGDEAAHYRSLADRSAQAFHREFWDETKGGYGSNNQACNTLALYFDLAPASLRPSVAANLVKDIHAHDDHLTTGNLCTRFIFDVLTDQGQAELAFRLATQTTYPSWGYMLENGATTVWERWEKATGGGMNSHNHPMYAAVDAWLYRAAGGLQPDDSLEVEGAAFERFRVYPVLAGLLKQGRASLRTVKGRVGVDWRLEGDGELRIDVEVPVNSRAEIILPSLGGWPGRLWIDGQAAWQPGEVGQVPGWEIYPELAGKIAFRLFGGCGTHRIRMA
jgi:alpha-L-rhamnosidase